MQQTSIITSDPLLDTESDETEAVTAAHEVRQVRILPPYEPGRLDKVLVSIAPEFSRSYLQQLVEDGCVAVNDQTVGKAAHKVRLGDSLSLALRPTPQSQAFKPEAMALDVVYEDEQLLVINKPAGLVVHPAPGNWSGTLLNGLLAWAPELVMLPRAGIVHRLDKDTSGLMVVARTRACMDYLVQAIAARDVKREYLALAHRPWRGAAQRTVEVAIGRDPQNRLRMAAVDLAVHAGKPAKTDITCLGSNDTGCLVHCALHTGRTHQIRVHMAYLQHPLVGDVLYGGQQEPAMQRQALHAFRLAFQHPTSGQLLQFESTPATDWMGLLQKWGLRYN